MYPVNVNYKNKNQLCIIGKIKRQAKTSLKTRGDFVSKSSSYKVLINKDKIKNRIFNSVFYFLQIIQPHYVLLMHRLKRFFCL
jgi:hypothetical protein